jgi:hypothetical protein
MPTRFAAVINVADYYRAGQPIATAIAQALSDATNMAGAILFLAPNLPAGGDLTVAGPNVAIMDYRPGGANLQVQQDSGLAFVSQTNAAAAAAGTLSNAPVAGNPAHWLNVKINGATRRIPCW